MSPSTAKSSAPWTTTTCGWDQLAGVNVRLAGTGVPSLSSELERAMTTSALGAVSSTRVNVALSPDSLVTRPAVGVTSMPTASSSVLLTATSAASMPV